MLQRTVFARYSVKKEADHLYVHKWEAEGNKKG
jgi:hypothetical protein